MPLTAFAIGLAVGWPMTSRASEQSRPSGLERTWRVDSVASYLGLADASSFSSGVTCQLYFNRRSPAVWVVSLCHR